MSDDQSAPRSAIARRLRELIVDLDCGSYGERHNIAQSDIDIILKDLRECCTEDLDAALRHQSPAQATARAPSSTKAEAPTLTEEEACAECAHQIYDHSAEGCRVRRSDDSLCGCQCFRFKNEGVIQ